jgi:hypothetical protein
LRRDVNEPPSTVFTRSSARARGSLAETPSRTTAITLCGASGRSTSTKRGRTAAIALTCASGSLAPEGA